MAGHSKWANIKHRKAKTDAIKGRLFTKIAREIIVAARSGGSDPNGNFRLKIAIDNARAANMPNDNIQRAIQKGMGGEDGANYEELRYEGYVPGGVAIMTVVMTDNRNRTAGEMRHLFSKHGGNLGETGCVNWMFTEKGQLTVDKESFKQSEDDLLLLALESGADDVENQDESYEIFTRPEMMEEVRQTLLDKDVPIQNAAINLIPENKIEISDVNQAKKVIKLIDYMEEHDDVQKVYTNFEIADSLMDEEL